MFDNEKFFVFEFVVEDEICLQTTNISRIEQENKAQEGKNDETLERQIEVRSVFTDRIPSFSNSWDVQTVTYFIMF